MTPETLEILPVSELHPHPRNPRIEPRKEVVDQIAAQIGEKFDLSHALIVRPNMSGFEIISGHHRWLAAQQVGLITVPCWVRDYDDDTAYMQLALCNTQSELHPLEEGKHAAESGMDLKAYAERLGKARTTLSTKVRAWSVMAVTDIGHERARVTWSQLAEIHAAPDWLWAALVERMLALEWTVVTTREKVASCKGWKEPPEWTDRAKIAAGLVANELRYSDIAKLGDLVSGMRVKNEDRRELCLDELAGAFVASLSAAQAIVAKHEALEAQEAVETQRQAEQTAARVVRLRANCSLDEWKSLQPEERARLLEPVAYQGASSSFNKQENADIEWAQWSWNPITGCRHECPYCYAREIATSARMAKVYPNGFEPTFRSNALQAPYNTKVPEQANADTRFRNVFTGSMADMFGRWVPSVWISTVLDVMSDNPQWNFLTLTKFPNRLGEFDIPKNAWMGTTVDMQARVKAAEKAFAKVQSGVKWLSVEPMLEPLKFSQLELFNWVVIGGASATSATPEWHPPYRWVVDLVEQCRASGVRVYFKTNLFGKTTARLLELPFDAPIKGDNESLPSVLRYLPESPKP